MKQRVIIAIALVLNPKILIADEPTTALDVTIQAQVLDTIQALRQHLNTGGKRNEKDSSRPAAGCCHAELRCRHRFCR